jgi:hypothetical protein
MVSMTYHLTCEPRSWLAPQGVAGGGRTGRKAKFRARPAADAAPITRSARRGLLSLSRLGMTVVAVLHQPRYALFRLFQQVSHQYHNFCLGVDHCSQCPAPGLGGCALSGAAPAAGTT